MDAIDGDSHFSEPLDLFERYTDPRYRDRTVRVARSSTTGERSLIVDGKPMILVDVEELLGALVGYGQKESGADLGTFDRYLIESARWQDMSERVRYLDSEGFAAQVIYPSLGLIWEGSVKDPLLADALCRAYNTWAFELCAGHADRLYPAAHISLRDASLAVRELERVAKLGCKAIFVAAAPVDGKSFGHASLDPVWAAAQDLDLAVGIHLAGHPNYTGHDWYRDEYPGFMFVTMNVIQDPRMALTTMVYDGVFERFPNLKGGVIEAGAGWAPEFLRELDLAFKSFGRTDPYLKAMTLKPSEQLRRAVKFTPFPGEDVGRMIRDGGADLFMFSSDYPHPEGTNDPLGRFERTMEGLDEDAKDRFYRRNFEQMMGLDALVPA